MNRVIKFFRYDGFLTMLYFEGNVCYKERNANGERYNLLDKYGIISKDGEDYFSIDFHDGRQYYKIVGNTIDFDPKKGLTRIP